VWLPGDDLTGYLRDNLSWLERARAGASLVGAGASVALGIALSKCLVGAGARLEGKGSVERCLIMAGAVAHAPLSDAIVTPSGRVVRVGGAASSAGSASA
jgi:hypothetical protein